MRHTFLRTLVELLLLATMFAGPAAALAAAPAHGDRLWVYVGTYTQRGSKGIYLCQLDVAAGKLEPGCLVAETASPSFVVRHPSLPVLYAIGEIGRVNGKPGGAVSAFSIAPKTGTLTLINQQNSGGPGPCHVAVDHGGRCVLVANYGGGSVAALPIDATGKLGEAVSVIQHTGTGANPKRQKGPHAHSIYVDAADRFVLTADLGIDKVLVYRLDPAAAKLTANQPPCCDAAPGAGPRHLAFHPNGKWVYAINELNNTVTQMKYDAALGRLEAVQSIGTLPEGFQGSNTTAEVQIHPSGKFLYGSNRGHDSIAIFAIDAATGGLRLLGHEPTQGKSPRNFALDPSGRCLLAANQDGDNIVVFRVDAATGLLRPTGSSVSQVPRCASK